MSDEPGGAEVSDEVRAAGRAVLERLSADEEFRAAVRSDPFTALTGAGIPEGLMPDLLAAAVEDAGDDVQGFVAPTEGCAPPLPTDWCIVFPFRAQGGPTTRVNSIYCQRSAWY